MEALPRASADDSVPQNAQWGGFKLDRVTGLEPAVEFQAAASGDSSGADEVSRVQRFVAGDVFDDPGEAEVHF